MCAFLKKRTEYILEYPALDRSKEKGRKSKKCKQL